MSVSIFLVINIPGKKVSIKQMAIYEVQKIFSKVKQSHQKRKFKLTFKFRSHFNLWNPIHKNWWNHCSAKFYTLHLNAVVLAGYSKHILLSLGWVTFLVLQVRVLLCVLESVRVSVPLRFERVCLELWRELGVTVEHPMHHCVALRSSGDSAGQDLSMSSARHRAQQSHIHVVCCRSCSASLLHSHWNELGKKITCGYRLVTPGYIHLKICNPFVKDGFSKLNTHTTEQA